MSTRPPLAALAALALLAAPLAAQDAPAVVTKVTADLGYVQASGNSRVTTMNVGEKLTQQRGRLTIAQTFAFVYGKTRDSVSTNNLRTGLRGDYRIDRLFALFVGVTYDRNRFAGIERRWEEALGMQARLIGTASDTLRVEGGGTVTQQVGVDGTQRNFPSVRAAASWRHAFSRTSYFQQQLEYIPNLRETVDWRVNSESSVVAPVSQRIGVKLSYVIRYDNLPQPGFTETDKLFTTGIQITF
jgi:putative salt-induced outer membrane protein